MPLKLTIAATGQVTLRQAVLDHLKVRPGQKIEVSLLPDGRVEFRATEPTASIARLRGALRRPRRRPVSLAAMQDAIAHG